nr:hypothetical protein CFP56_67710 [Quercus suber]
MSAVYPNWRLDQWKKKSPEMTQLGWMCFWHYRLEKVVIFRTIAPMSGLVRTLHTAKMSDVWLITIALAETPAFVFIFTAAQSSIFESSLRGDAKT